MKVVRILLVKIGNYWQLGFVDNALFYWNDGQGSVRAFSWKWLYVLANLCQNFMKLAQFLPWVLLKIPRRNNCWTGVILRSIYP